MSQQHHLPAKLRKYEAVPYTALDKHWDKLLRVPTK